MPTIKPRTKAPKPEQLAGGLGGSAAYQSRPLVGLLWIIYEELAPISKQLCGVVSPMVIIETRKFALDVLPYRRTFNRLLVEAVGIIKRLPEHERAKVETLLFKPDELKQFFLRKLG